MVNRSLTTHHSRSILQLLQLWCFYPGHSNNKYGHAAAKNHRWYRSHKAGSQAAFKFAQFIAAVHKHRTHRAYPSTHIVRHVQLQNGGTDDHADTIKQTTEKQAPKG